jgi:hypothetical protein
MCKRGNSIIAGLVYPTRAAASQLPHRRCPISLPPPRKRRRQLARRDNSQMRLVSLSTALFVGLASGIAPAAGAEWQRFAIPSSGASAEIPVSIFSEETELPDGGVGRRFYTDDRRADLTVQSVANPGDDSPAAFLMRRNPPPGIVYKRVTPSFFVVSSVRNDRIWYNRCNRSPGYMNCVLINYPRAEKRQWDSVVTRISLTLTR